MAAAVTTTPQAPITPQVQINNPIANGPAYAAINNMSQPDRSAFQFAMRGLEDQAWAQQVCQVTGKVVTVAVKFRDDVNFDVGLRGEGVTGISWNANLASLVQANPTPKARDFVFVVAPADMNNKISFKLVGNSNGEKWQNGNNVEVDLSAHGHNAYIPVADVAFD